MPDIAAYIIHYSRLIDRLENISELQHLIPGKATVVTEKEINSESSKSLSSSSMNSIKKQIRVISDYLLLHEIFLGTNTHPIEKAHKFKSIYLQYICFADYYSRYTSQALSSFSFANQELCKQHYHAMSLFLKEDSKYCLILEDDSVFKEPEVFDIIIQSLSIHPQDIPLFMDLSNSLNLGQIYNKQDPIYPYYKVLEGQTRCSCAYLINKAAIHSLRKFQDFVLPVDWHLTYALKAENITTYWSQGSIFCQGSESGSFSSNSTSRNK